MNWILSFLLPCAAFATTTREATRVLYRCDIANDKHGIAAFDSAGELIGSACDTRLGKSDNQTIAITVKPGPPYIGNITIGAFRFNMHSNPGHASEPACSRIYNDHELEIDCSIPTHDIDQEDLAEALDSQQGSCFDDVIASQNLLEGHRLIDTSLATIEPETGNMANCSGNQPTASLSKRNGGCVTEGKTRLVYDGNPHQDLLHRQLTTPHDCDRSTCNVATSDSTATAFSLNAQVHVFQWIDGGFAVTATWTESESHGCTGSPGETICMWYRAAYTAYTIQNYENTACEEGGAQVNKGDPFVLRSPNANGVGSDFYCVTGTCRTKGAHYWEVNRRAGGP